MLTIMNTKAHTNYKSYNHTTLIPPHYNPGHLNHGRFWCRIHLWFCLMGVCKQSRWRHSVTVPSRHKMADMRYYGNIMTTTRWRLYVTMETLCQQQDGGYALLWQHYDNNKMAAICYYGNVMSTTRWRLCVFYIFNSTVIDWTYYMFFL